MKIVKKIFLMLFVFFVGIITVNAETKNIKVTSVTVKEKSTTIEVADPVVSENEITSNITFNQLNDYVTFELTLKNNESEKYKITSITDNNTNTNLEVEYDYSNDFISSNDEAKVRVKLTYKNQLTNSNISFDNLTITFNVENAKGDTSQIVLNPNTGDNVLHYLVLLIIAITGLILIVRKKKTKIGALVLALGIIIIPFAVLAEEKFELNFKFTNIEVKGEFEEYNVTVDKGDGTKPTVLTITYGETVGELPDAPSKEGHTFIGWIDEQNREVSEDTVITGPINITPVYKKDKHTLTITHPEYLNEGDVSGLYEYGTQITLTAQARDGFTFSKWSDDVTDNPRTITIGITDITIEPIYIANDPIEATFKKGEIVYTRMQELSGNKENIWSNTTTANTKIEYFKKSEIAPNLDTITENNILSTDDSDVPIYVWWDNDTKTIYWWSEAEKVYMNEDSSYFFHGMYVMKNIDVRGLDTSRVTSMSCMFRWNRSLENIDLSSFDTSNVTNMGAMFYDCHSLTELNISSFDTSNVIYMYQMFYNCDGLHDLDVSGFNTSKVTNMKFMFGQCDGLTELDLSSFDTSNVEDMEGMFLSTSNIEKIYVSDKFVTTSITDPSRLIFNNTTKLTGSRGTKCINARASYAHVDGGICNPGCFSYKEHEVEFNPNGGSVSLESKYVRIDDKIGALPTPIRNGYSFIGWFTLETGGEKITSDYKPQENITLYAHWQESSNKLVELADNGDGEISIGDIVRLGNEEFYVLSNENSQVKMIPKYSLDSNYRQSKDNYETVKFSDYEYWINRYAASSSSSSNLSADDIQDIYATESDNISYVYRDKKGNETDNYVKHYVNNYKAYLKDDLGISQISDVRLLSYTDYQLTTCKNNSTLCLKLNEYEEPNDYSFWLGSASESSIMVNTSDLNYTSCNSTSSVRPLVVISKSALEN